jgi:hypothetical protein
MADASLGIGIGIIEATSIVEDIARVAQSLEVLHPSHLIEFAGPGCILIWCILIPTTSPRTDTLDPVLGQERAHDGYAGAKQTHAWFDCGPDDRS